MGRHNASYIAAQGNFTRSTTSGAAKYVGGVGAMALSLWAGAAIAGGGIANADETAGSPADPAGAVKSALHSLTGNLSHALGGGSAADGSSSLKLPKSGLFTLPKASDGGNAFTGPLASLAGRGSHQTPQSEAAPKSNSQRSITPGASPGEATAPIVGAVKEALRGGGPTPGATTFGSTDPIVAKTSAASLTSFGPTTAGAQRFSPTAATVPTGFLTALGINPLTNTGGSPAVPAAAVLPGALQLLRRETTQTSLAQPLSLTSIGSLLNPTPAPAPVLPTHPSTPSTTAVAPGATDVQQNVTYIDANGNPVNIGSVGKYMLKSDGTVSDYGGQTVDGGKTLVEPVNVIIVDPTSKTPAEASAKLNKAMFLSGFPPQPIHTGGFMGLIGAKNYGQKPLIPLTAYSDNLFILDNDHGRIFGPAPEPAASGGGYVWSGAFSSETLGVSENGIPGHNYVSSNAARDALALKLIASGQVQSIQYVPMNNAIDPNGATAADYSSGDHDGYAMVIVLK